MSRRHLRDIDLNLLVCLDALLRHRSVSAAADELGLSQSGASRALQRLREQLEDPLLVQVGRRLEPTARARELAEPVAEVLSRAAEVFRSPTFDARAAGGAIRIGIPDHLAWLIGADLLHRLEVEAPNLDVVLRSFSRDWRTELRDGVVDLAFGVVSGDEAQLRQRTVFHDPWRVLLAEDHPALSEPLTMQRFAALDHGMMTVSGTGPGHVDQALAAHGLSRRVRMRASSPLVVAMLARETELVVTTTAWLATALSQLGGFVVRELPLEVPALPLPLVWHELNDADARHRWARDLIADVVRAARAPELGVC